MGRVLHTWYLEEILIKFLNYTIQILMFATRFGYRFDLKRSIWFLPRFCIFVSFPTEMAFCIFLNQCGPRTQILRHFQKILMLIWSKPETFCNQCCNLLHIIYRACTFLLKIFQSSYDVMYWLWLYSDSIWCKYIFIAVFAKLVIGT